jgi:archaellum component FlaC
MHELSKTGRWLGGTTPTGYASEQVKNVAVDGKVRKSCKLKAIPEEAKIVKLIYNKFLEVNSLTKTETFLLQDGYATKNGNQFTRFAIKAILTNPAYMIADEDAYRYLTENGVELFAEKEKFDGKHGILAYNRTLQKPNKANQTRPMSEWIVSVGKHEGFISGAQWVKVQRMLGQNTSKSYRKPRSNVALLSGILVCSKCGSYMRPKLTNRVNTQGEQIYTYMCNLKERSRRHCCDMKSVNGNILDKAIIDEIKKLSEDNSEFMRQLENSQKMLAGNLEGYEEQIAGLNNEINENEREIKALVSSLSKASGTSAEYYIMQQIEELHDKSEILKRRLDDLKQLTETHELSDIEFDVFRQMLCSFKTMIDSMSVEQKRAAIRTCVKKIVWDGEDVQIYLFGSDDKYVIHEKPTIERYNNIEEKEPLGENSKRASNAL